MNIQIRKGKWKLTEFRWANALKMLIVLVRAMCGRTGWAKSTVTTIH